MVRLEKRVIGGTVYWYLTHTTKVDGKVVQRREYFGKRLPRDVEERKRLLLDEVRRERWGPALARIRAGWQRERARMPAEAKEKEAESFAIRFTYSTQRIEGSKLTLRETADLLERGIAPAGKPVADVKEAEAHKRVLETVLRERRELGLELLLEWHERLFRETKPGIAGKVREHGVRISGSGFRPPGPAEVRGLLMGFFRWWARSAGMQPVERAALAHLKLVTVHPFADGNGRLSRLLMNFVLHRAGYPLLNIPYKGRAGYYNALERAQMSRNEQAFVQWMFRQYVKAHRGYLQE